MAPEIDWSEFTTEPPGEQPAAQAVDWSQFSTTPDDAGPPMADFSNASGGSASVPLAQFDDAIVGYDTNGQPILAPQGRGPDLHLKSGYQGIAEDYQYPEDERRKVGLGEGMARSAFDTLSSFPSAAYRATPLGLLDAAAQAAGYRTPESVLTEHAHKNLGMDEESLRFAGAREEAIARAVPELVANLIPLGGAGELQRATRVVDDFVAPEARAIMDAHPAGRDMAAAGELGPEAQGSAIADDILERSAAAQAERAAAAPEVVPAERAEPVHGETGKPVGDEAGTVEGAQAQEQNVAPAAPESAVEVSELSPEDLPPEFRSRLQQQETPTVEATPEELAALQRQSRETINPDDVRVVPKDEQTFIANGSGDVQGVGSVEAGGRVIEDKDLGRTRAVIERNGEVRPLVGVDAVDTHARPGQVIVQRGIGSDEWTILSHGDDLPPRLAKSRINAERAKLDQLHAEESANASPVRSDQGPPVVAREVPEGVGADRGGNVQQPQAPRVEANGAELRPSHEPVRDYGAAPNQGPLTSVKNRVVADERAARGMDELNYEGKRTFGQAWDKARARMADETAGQSLAHSIVERPRALNAEENALLSMERARLNKQHRETMADIAHAMETKDIDAETMARGRLRDIEAQLEVADRAAKAGGAEGGFGLAARRMMTKEDYSLAEMLTEAKVRKGAELTPKDRARVEAIAARLDAVEKELAAVRAQAAKKATRRAPQSVQARYEDLKAQLRSIPKKEHTICGV